MNKVLEECKRLIDKNALHRKGFRIGESTPFDHIVYGVGELTELKNAEVDSLMFVRGAVGGESKEADYRAHCLEELADTINYLMFYAVSKEFTPDQIEAECLRKLSIRFTEEEKDATDH